MNSPDLRHRIDTELEHLAPMPDVCSAALRAGARHVRRRRLAGTAMVGVAAAAVTGAVVINQSDAPDRDRTDQNSNVADDPTPKSPPKAAGFDYAAARQGGITEDEWWQAQAAFWNEQLPGQYGKVIVVEQGNRNPPILNTTGAEKMSLGMSVSGRMKSENSAEDPQNWSCAGVRQAAAETTQIEWRILGCAEAEFGTGWWARATSERSTSDDAMGTVPNHAGGLLVMNDNNFVQLGLVPLGEDRPVPLSVAEQVRIAQTPEFMELAEFGTDYSAARDYSGEKLISKPIRPTWPGV